MEARLQYPNLIDPQSTVGLKYTKAPFLDVETAIKDLQWQVIPMEPDKTVTCQSMTSV